VDLYRQADEVKGEVRLTSEFRYSKELQLFDVQEIDKPVQAGQTNNPTGNLLFYRRQTTFWASEELTFVVESADQSHWVGDWHILGPHLEVTAFHH
jgi:hypothetical protein